MDQGEDGIRRARTNEFLLNALGGIVLALAVIMALILLATPHALAALVPGVFAALLSVPLYLSWKAHRRTRGDLPAGERVDAPDMGGAMLSASVSRSGAATLATSAANAASASRRDDPPKTEPVP